MLTGAIHVDGFMDSCDALFASVPVERRLEIMKDPRHGTFAVAFFATAAALWIAALWSLPAPLLPQSIAFAAGGARAATVLNAYCVPYARGGAIAAAFTARPPIGVLVVAYAVLVALAFTIAPWAWTLLVPALLGSLAAGQRLKLRLGGGLTGDVYGYLVVCFEIALLLGIVLILRFT